MTQFFTINYPDLLSICHKLSAADPERTKTDLDLLSENIAQSNLALIYQGIIPIEINHCNLEVTLLGEPFPSTFLTIDNYGCDTYEEKVIQHLLNAIEVAQDIVDGNKIFRSIPLTSSSAIN